MTPTEQALAWNQAREDRSRPLTAFESGMIERARQTVLNDLPGTTHQYGLLKAALANLRTSDVRVKVGTEHNADKSEFGLMTLRAVARRPRHRRLPGHS